MVRNFRSRNGSPERPTRSWRNTTGPRDVSRTVNAHTPATSAAGTASTATTTRSNARLPRYEPAECFIALSGWVSPSTTAIWNQRLGVGPAVDVRLDHPAGAGEVPTLPEPRPGVAALRDPRRGDTEAALRPRRDVAREDPRRELLRYALAAQPAYEDAGGQRHRPTHEVEVEPRHADLDAELHAGAIYVGQTETGKVDLQVECGRFLQRRP